jgi:arginyl-tRNA synthetase
LQAVPILGEEDLERKFKSTTVTKKLPEVIVSSFKLLGINVPDRM